MPAGRVSNAEPELHALPHVISVDHGERTVLLDAEEERYFSLNVTGRAVWELLCDGTTRDQIVERLAQRFDVDTQQISHDVDQLLDQLIHVKLVVRR